MHPKIVNQLLQAALALEGYTVLTAPSALYNAMRKKIEATGKL